MSARTWLWRAVFFLLIIIVVLQFYLLLETGHSPWKPKDKSQSSDLRQDQPHSMGFEDADEMSDFLLSLYQDNDEDIALLRKKPVKNSNGPTPTPIGGTEQSQPLSKRFAYITGGFVGSIWEMLMTASLAQQLEDVQAGAELLIFTHPNVDEEDRMILESLPHSRVLPSVELPNLENSTDPGISGGHIYATYKILFLDPPASEEIKKFVWLDQDIFIAQNVDELFGLPHISSPYDRKGCDVDFGLGISSGCVVASRDTDALNTMMEKLMKRERNIRSDQQLLYDHFYPTRWHPVPQIYQHMPSVFKHSQTQIHGTKIFHFAWGDPKPTEIYSRVGGAWLSPDAEIGGMPPCMAKPYIMWMDALHRVAKGRFKLPIFDGTTDGDRMKYIGPTPTVTPLTTPTAAPAPLREERKCEGDRCYTFRYLPETDAAIAHYQSLCQWSGGKKRDKFDGIMINMDANSTLMTQALNKAGKIFDVGDVALATSFRNDDDVTTGSYSEDLARIMMMIRCRVPFAVVRYGDGEIYIAREGANVEYRSSGPEWAYKPDSLPIPDVIRLLRRCFANTDDNFFHMLPILTCKEGYMDANKGGGGSMDWLNPMISQKLIKSKPKWWSYSCLFVNRNYAQFERFIKEEMQLYPEKIALIVNERVQASPPPWVSAIFKIPYQAPSWLQNDTNVIIDNVKAIAKAFTGWTFFVAAGPVSDVFIDVMWRENRQNQYIDVGSAFDQLVFGENTRSFFTNPLEMLQEEGCTETRWRLDGETVVSVH